jgi:hypothetical protein
MNDHKQTRLSVPREMRIISFIEEPASRLRWLSAMLLVATAGTQRCADGSPMGRQNRAHCQHQDNHLSVHSLIFSRPPMNL